MIRRIVWSAVVAATLAAASVVLAFFGEDAAIAVGLAAITSAVLSNRERR